MSILEITNVSKRFEPTSAAVHRVSLTVEPGEVLCLLGPSGCGKTTLLRMIAGLEKPDEGEIRFEGRDMADVPPHLRGFGMMFQDFALFPHKSVYGNVAFGLRMQDMPPDDIAVRVDEMLELVDLRGAEQRDVSRLSGGEQQRVALARSLAPRPRLLLLDEPLGALDRVLRERLMHEVRAILKRVGITSIFVTHDQTEAFAIADRVAVMNAGRIEQIAPPEIIYEDPATPFVARFLGYQNLLDGVVEGDGTVVTTIGRFRTGQSPSPRTAVTLLIMPQLSESPMTSRVTVGDEHNVISGVVDEVSFRGRFSQIWIDTGGQRLLFEDNGRVDAAPGQMVTIRITPDLLRLYEPQVENSEAD